MRKNFWKKALAMALCAVMTVPAVACGDKVGSGEKVDKTKTQLNVFHYFAGFGDAWLIELADNFEEAVKDISFEEGKTGVQVHKRGEMTDFDSGKLKSSAYDVFFLEGPKNFLNLMATNSLEPLDSIMTTPNADDGNQTIESKMTAQQQAAYTYGEHYYGIPHYAGNYGLVYNRDMFEERGFFIAAEPDLETGDIFVSATNTQKSVGPDGKTGVIGGIDYSDDDGLPRTYDEFFELCELIYANGIDPICWPGMYKQQHIVMLLDNLVANNLGAEQANIRYTFEGEAKNLVVIEDGKPKRDADGNFVTETMTVSDGDAWNVARAEGVYYAFEFIHKILNTPNYYSKSADLTSVSHTENQQNFLENGSLGKRQSAMLADGTWWQMEADNVFAYMAAQDEKYSKENRKFGWLPLPQPNEAEAAKVASGEKNMTFSDYLNAVACIKADLPTGVRDAALAFLKYAYTDKALTDFTYTTSTTIGVDYLDQVDRSKLNYYTASLINYLDKSDIIYQVSANSRYMQNRNTLTVTSIYGSGSYKDIIAGSSMSVDDFFAGHTDFYKGCAW